MEKLLADVANFQAKVLGIIRKKIRLLTADELNFYGLALQEEFVELVTAVENNSIGEQADALIDILYFTLGRLNEIGLTGVDAQALFDFVHAANMQKVKGLKKSRQSIGVSDAVKPEHFKDPTLLISEYLKIRQQQQQRNG